MSRLVTQKAILIPILLMAALMSGRAQDRQFQTLDSLTDNLNSRWDEQNPVIHPNSKSMYITRANDSANVGGPADRGDIWIAEMGQDGTWGTPRHGGTTLNDALYNSILGFSPDGEIVFVNMMKQLPGGLVVVDGIGYSQRRGADWSPIRRVPLDYYLNRSGHQSGSISRDGRIMVLSMESYASRGGEDLYVTSYEDGRWTQPVNLGDDINTTGQEMTPYLAADNRTLYFSSNGHGGYGGRDLFEATRKDDTWKSWSRPKNLGTTVNSEGVELSYFIDHHRDIAYYTSTRNSDGYGDVRAIVAVEEEVSPTEEVQFEELIAVEETVAPQTEMTLRGLVVNAKNGEPLTSAVSLRWLDEEQFLNTTSVSGTFEAPLPRDVETVTISVKSPGFMAEEQIMAPDTVGEAVRFALTPLEKGMVFTLNRVFFERGKAVLLDSSFAELDRIAEVLQENPEIVVELSGHTDNQGSARLNLRLSRDRVEVVKNYLVAQGVNKARVKGKGYGGTRPIASNASEKTRKLNRRVEFKIVEGVTNE